MDVTSKYRNFVDLKGRQKCAYCPFPVYTPVSDTLCVNCFAREHDSTTTHHAGNDGGDTSTRSRSKSRSRVMSRSNARSRSPIAGRAGVTSFHQSRSAPRADLEALKTRLTSTVEMVVYENMNLH